MADIEEGDDTFDPIVPDGWKDTTDENWHFDVNIEKGNRIWIYSDNGCVDEIIRFVQHLMVKFNLKDPVSFEWSHSCSKPRTDAYGGGAAFITATEEKTFNTHRWLLEQQARFDGNTEL